MKGIKDLWKWLIEADSFGLLLLAMVALVIVGGLFISFDDFLYQSPAEDLACQDLGMEHQNYNGKPYCIEGDLIHPVIMDCSGYLWNTQCKARLIQ